MSEQKSVPINLLLADVRQALFDAVKTDDGASNALRYEVGRAIGLMGHAMDITAALVEAAPDSANLLCQYADFIRTVKADDLERHPYLPSIEEAALKLSAAIAEATGVPA